jgi:hypothetical protein
MKITKEYNKSGDLVYALIELTMEESQPDWIIEAVKELKAKERARNLKSGKRQGV